MGEDFAVSPSTVLLFSSIDNVGNGDSVCIMIDILDDLIYEETQEFVAQIQVISSPSIAIVGTPDSVTKTIEDNEGWFNYTRVKC